MATYIFKALLIIFINEEVFKSCVVIGVNAHDNTFYDYNGLFKIPESSITESHGDISPSDVYAQTPDFVTKYGYPLETHTVTTDDGYLLTVHRIPGSPKVAPSGVKTPVFLVHGIFASSELYVVLGPDKSLGFLLADEGYDVWMMNTRGNFYSRKHVTLSPEDPKFWNFTWHEMGVYDLPAVIDYILATTNHQQLFYIGHSMGTTVFYVMNSVRPEYNKKIRLGVSMAPVVFHNMPRSRLLQTVLRNANLVYRVLHAGGIDEVFPRLKSVQTALGQACRVGSPLLHVCTAFYETMFGYHRDMFDTEILPVIFSHIFCGTSLITVAHFAENILAGRFQVFDPTVTPGKITPEYNLSQVTAPVYLLYADKDILAHPDAVMRLNRSLPNVVRLQRLDDPVAGHTDFVFAKNVKQLVYDQIIREMNRYR